MKGTSCCYLSFTEEEQFIEVNSPCVCFCNKPNLSIMLWHILSSWRETAAKSSHSDQTQTVTRCSQLCGLDWCPDQTVVLFTLKGSGKCNYWKTYVAVILQLMLLVFLFTHKGLLKIDFQVNSWCVGIEGKIACVFTRHEIFLCFTSFDVRELSGLLFGFILWLVYFPSVQIKTEKCQETT